MTLTDEVCDDCRLKNCTVTYDNETRVIYHSPNIQEDGVIATVVLREDEAIDVVALTFTTAIHALAPSDLDVGINEAQAYSSVIKDRLNNRIEPSQFELLERLHAAGLIED